MGISLSSIHIYGNSETLECGFSFQAFSPNWLTCTEDFSEREPSFPAETSKILSKKISATVLCFHIFDSEMISFDVFCGGKLAARYSDDEFTANNKLYDIPALLGCEEEQKKRLSVILSCADVDLKIEMLEEYLGVCLLFLPELADKPELLLRKRSDTIYRKFQEQERALIGGGRPFK